MDNQEFDAIVDAQLRHIKKSLKVKGSEYSASQDRLGNFRRVALREETSMERVLWGFYLKHDDSLRTMLDSTPPLDVVDEKIGDMINYLILLKAIFYEKIKELEKVGY